MHRWRGRSSPAPWLAALWLCTGCASKRAAPATAPASATAPTLIALLPDPDTGAILSNHRRVNSGQRIPDRIADEPQRAGFFKQGAAQPGRDAGIVAEPDPVRGIALGAVAGDGDPCQPRHFTHQRIGVDPELEQGARAGGFDHRIGAADEREQRRSVPGIAQVHSDIGLALVG